MPSGDDRDAQASTYADLDALVQAPPASGEFVDAAMDVSTVSAGQGASNEEGSRNNFEDEAAEILAVVESTESKLEEMAAITEGLQLSISQLRALLQEIPEEQAAGGLLDRFHDLDTEWQHFRGKPLEARTERESKRLMTKIMGIQTDMSTMVSAVMPGKEEKKNFPRSVYGCAC